MSAILAFLGRAGFEGWDFFYLAMSVAALGFAALSHERDRRHAVQIAVALLFGDCCYIATRLTGVEWFWPGMDAALAWFVAVRDRRQPRHWKLFIVACLFAQELAHVRRWFGDAFGGPFYGYGLTLNLLFIGQLLAVSTPGGKRVVERMGDFVASRGGPGGRWRVSLLSRASDRPEQP